MSKIIYLISSFALIFCTYAEDIRIAIPKDGQPPFGFKKGAQERGIYPEILDLISEKTGDKFILLYQPTKRIRISFENGSIDAEIGVNPAWYSQSKVKSLFTESFAKAEDIVLFSPGHKVKVDGPESLKGKALGVIRGYFYPGFMDAFANGSMIRKDFNSEKQIITLLGKKRLKQAFVRKGIALYFMSSPKPEWNSLVAGDTIGSVDIMIRLNKDKTAALKRINKAIKELKASGAIDNIYLKYR